MISILFSAMIFVVAVLTAIYVIVYWPKKINHWEIRNEKDYQKNKKKDN